jgi:DNA (cytosine-5)-methyltransferase 1
VGDTKDITVLSLCTGYGGLELGFAAAIGRPLRVVAVEIEAYAQALLVAQAEQGNLAIEAVYSDIKTFPAERFSGCFDFLIAGYPCQPFSVAGKQEAEKDPRHLWPVVCDIAKQVKPQVIFCENVAGHLRIGFDIVVKDLDDLGYDVEAGIFAASEIGAPHRRERLFILAHARSPRIGDIDYSIDWGIGKKILRQGDRQECTDRVAATSELGDTEHLRLDKGITGNGRTKERKGRSYRQVIDRSDELGDTEHDGHASTTEQGSTGETISDNSKGENETSKSKRASGSRELADTESKRVQGHRTQGKQESEVHAGQEVSLRSSQGNGWPARPKQKQYDWEEPRMLLRRGSRSSSIDSSSEPSMGCTVDGFNSRVDELRLLGNGCVPQQVEFAFRYLMMKMFIQRLEKKLIQKAFF